jgi:hypothetical protein
MQVTSHRTFDETPYSSDALEAVIATGADCLLTSGRAPDAPWKFFRSVVRIWNVPELKHLSLSYIPRKQRRNQASALSGEICDNASVMA